MVRKVTRCAVAAVPVLLCLVLAGCYRLAVDDAGPKGEEVTQHDRSLGSGDRIKTAEGSMLSATRCRLDYRLYLPERRTTDGIVILAPGFMRAKERMDGLARTLAEAGITTATLDFCNTRLWDGRHVQNGRDMVLLAHSLGRRPVVYAGFSAGGLAALVAARQDTTAVGVVALDLVDDGGLGVRTAGELDKPLVGLMGEPSACNAEGNGVPVFSASRISEAELVRGAGHCDFESPTTWFCELVCGRTGRSTSLRLGIIASAVSASAELLASKPGRM